MRRIIASLVVLGFVLGSSALPAAETSKKRVLYVTRTGGFHHEACEYSVPVFKKLAGETGILEVVATDKVDLLTAKGLEGFDVVVFSNTSGPKKDFGLSDENGNALVDWVKGGKAFVGIHAATDSMADFPPYVEMIGGSFNGHPWTKKVKVDIEDPLHPCAVDLPSPWMVDDEIYTVKEWSRDKVDVILSLDVSGETDKGNRDDRDYALAWCKPCGSGRVFYTALGHRPQVWDDPVYQKHLMAGVLWTLRMAPRAILRTLKDDFKVIPGIPEPEDYPISLGHKKPGEWQRIFDGKALLFGTDWEATDQREVTRKHWTVQPGGIIQGDSRGSPEGSSHLYYIKRKYRNFEFRAEVCINKEGNSGMYFRCLDSNHEPNGNWKNWPTGYEAQVNNGWAPDPRKSGSFYPEPSVREADLKRYIGYDKAKDDDNFWFTQHIIGVGDRFVIKLDGKVVTATVNPNPEDKRSFAEGYVAFQLHHPGAIVKFRNIEVRELP